MSETVNNLKVEVIITGSVAGDDGARLAVSMHETFNFSDGNSSNQVSKVWQDLTRPLDTTAEDLDLGTDGLDDFQGADLVPPKVKVLLLRNLSTTTGQALTLQDASSNDGGPMGGTSPTFPIGPNGLLLAINPTDGYTLTDGSADRLGIATSADMTYRVLIAG